MDSLPYSVRDVQAVLDYIYLGKGPFDAPSEEMPNPIEEMPIRLPFLS